MDTHTWFLFTLAALALALTPGPNSLLVLNHGARYGHRATRATVAGGALGFGLMMGAALAGIGVLLQTSAAVLGVLKGVGALYLVWLGLQTWRSPPLNLQADTAGAAHTYTPPLARLGFLAAASNPKVLLFYAAFLPQFIDSNRPLWLQGGVMVLSFVGIEALVELALAGLAHQVRPWIERQGRRFNRACGALFVVMGLALPLSV